LQRSRFSRRERGDHQHRQIVVNLLQFFEDGHAVVPGIMTSTIAASNGSDFASSRPSAPPDARRTAYPSRVSGVSRISHDVFVVDDGWIRGEAFQ
jgi:hypothetical protein